MRRLERPLAVDESIVRLILDGTAGAASIARQRRALWVVLGVRADGQKVLLAVKSIGGESDGGGGLDAALAALWSDVPSTNIAIWRMRLNV